MIVQFGQLNTTVTQMTLVSYEGTKLTVSGELLPNKLQNVMLRQENLCSQKFEILVIAIEL